MSGVVAKRVARSSAAQGRQRTGAPFNVVGRPAAPTQRSREIGWSMMPRIGRPLWASAISVPNSGTPLMKDLVPSIGSSTQTNSASSRFAAIFLADDAVRREPRFDQLPHRRLGRAIGNGDRRQIGLVVNLDRGAKMRADRRPRGIRQLGGEREASVEVGRHRQLSSWPRSRGRHPPPTVPVRPRAVHLPVPPARVAGRGGG